jgi:hypothetical protein
MRLIAVAIFVILSTGITLSQTHSRFVPAKIDPAKKYVFYLHGRIVQESDPPVNSEYGLYDYPKIIEALKDPSYHLISERRAKGTTMEAYARHVKQQIDTLIAKGISPAKIAVVGASMGAGITMITAQMTKNDKLNFAFLAFCDPVTIEYVAREDVQVCGNFLSIYESSDEALSCDKVFVSQKCKTGYKEIKLSMNNRHGFIYQPYDEWVVPLKEWLRKL